MVHDIDPSVLIVITYVQVSHIAYGLGALYLLASHANYAPLSVSNWNGRLQYDVAG